MSRVKQPSDKKQVRRHGKNSNAMKGVLNGDGLSEGQQRSGQPEHRSLAGFAYLLIIVAGLLLAMRLGRPVLVPLAYALMIVTLITAIDSACANLVNRFRLPIGIWVTRLMSIVVVLGAITGLAFVLWEEAIVISKAMPQHVESISTKLTAFSESLPFNLGNELMLIVEQFSISAILPGFGLGSIGFLTSTLLVVIYSLFLSIERFAWIHKFTVVGEDWMRQTKGKSTNQETALNVTMDNVQQQVRRYIVYKTLVSVITGFIVYLMLLWFNFENAALFGLLAVILNFIPIFGSILAGIVTVAMALIQFDDLFTIFAIFLCFAAIQLAIGNLIEPRLLGHALNLSPVVILFSLGFWNLIWGIHGLFLAIPMTVTFVIIAMRFPATRSIAILLTRSGEISK